MRDRIAAGAIRLLTALVSAAVLVAGSGCASKAGPQTAPPPPVTRPATAPPAASPAPAPAPASPAAPAIRPATAALAQELGRIFDAPVFDRMQWAVLVQSLSSGETLYSRNAVEADDAGVEHEDRHAGGDRGAPRVGLQLRDATGRARRAVANGVLARRPGGRGKR